MIGREPPWPRHGPRPTMPTPSVLPALLASLAALVLAPAATALPRLLNAPVDLGADFSDPANLYFLPADLASFDVATGKGSLVWKRHRLGGGLTFNHRAASYESVGPDEWPKDVYAANPALPFELSFVDASTVRIRLRSTDLPPVRAAAPSLMLVGEPRDAGAWRGEKTEGGWRYVSDRGSVFIGEKPWRVELRDPAGRLLTATDLNRNVPGFGFVRRAADSSRSFSAAFSLSPGEHIYGGGESFTAFDKRGQRLVLSTTDAIGTEGPASYKPVPFFLSSRGYGLFLHTSSPVTADFGATNSSRSILTVGEDALDLFFFLGEPKDIIGSYTALTGRSPLPPLWSFGLWMSRITYKSEQETREVAAKLRELRIPADVIHLDTGWFQNDWECDYRFSPERFQDPAKMISDLRDQGFRVSLWQLPYFIPRNPLFPDILSRGLAIRDAQGGLPTADAILDFSNPDAVAWYQEKLAGLLKLGVGAIKTDFAEAAPYNGLYASGTTGFFEHNLYPLRYQQAASEITQKITGDSVIWARAGWAGAQRYPIHWGGDSQKTFGAMAGSLRGGLSLGVSGFSFWSHDIGGFFAKTDLEVYRKWLPFGMFTSHARVHGEPPKEPWHFDDAFVDDFRRDVELRYRLMPYLYAQAKDCSERGLPMLRAAFIEFPDDPGAWLVDDAYLFGSDVYVAPLFEAGATARDVYLPGKSAWIDYQNGRVYAPGWQRIEAGPVPAIVLVRDGAALPHAALAQSTKDIDWAKLELRVFATPAAKTATALIYLPGDPRPTALALTRAADGRFGLADNPLHGRVEWTVKTASIDSAR